MLMLPLMLMLLPMLPLPPPIAPAPPTELPLPKEDAGSDAFEVPLWKPACIPWLLSHA